MKMQTLEHPVYEHSTLHCNQQIIHHIHFNNQAFSTAWFRLYKINCPDQIIKSVKKRQAEFFFGRLASQQALSQFDSQGPVLMGNDRALF